MKRISIFVVLTLLINGCAYTSEELSFFEELNEKYPSYDFKIPDKLTGLDLIINSNEETLDSTEMIRIFEYANSLSKKYQGVNWKYLQFYNNAGYTLTLSENLQDSIIFLKYRH